MTASTHAEVGELKPRGLAPVLMAVTLLTLHALSDGGGATPLQRMLGGGLGVAAIFAGWRFWTLQLLHRLPLPELSLVQIYVFFGLPTVTGTVYGSHLRVSEGAVTSALVACWVFAGVAFAASGLGALLGRVVRPGVASFMPRQLGPGAVFIVPPWLVVVAAFNAGAAWFLPVSVRFAGTTVASFSGLLVYLATRQADDVGSASNLRQTLRVALLIALAGLLSGMLVQVLRPLTIAFVLIVLLQRRLPLRWLAVALALFVVLNPAKHVFRSSQGWSQFDKTRSSDGSMDHITLDPIEGGRAWWAAVETSWFGEVDSSSNTETSLERLNYLTSVARTLDYAGKRVPFDQGSRWTRIPISFVPRILNPEKPDMTREFNDRYNYLFGIQSTLSLRGTTVALPIIADGYWNFGWAGIAFVGCVAGLYWGFVSNLWEPKNFGVSWLAMHLFVGTTVTASFYDHVGGLPSIFFGILATSWGLYLVAKLFPRTGPRHAASSASSHT